MIGGLLSRLSDLLSRERTATIEVYEVPMSGSTVNLGQCCNTRYVGVDPGDQCLECGATFVHSRKDLAEGRVDA